MAEVLPNRCGLAATFGDALEQAHNAIARAVGECPIGNCVCAPSDGSQSVRLPTSPDHGCCSGWPDVCALPRPIGRYDAPFMARQSKMVLTQLVELLD